MIDLIQSYLPDGTSSNSKSRGFIPVSGTPVEMPFTFIHGTNPGKAFLLTAGVHDGERAKTGRNPGLFWSNASGVFQRFGRDSFVFGHFFGHYDQ
ncbi:hypothetical protein SAMN03080617_03904 [Algoriphagus alkaliphilus]|uniref:Succinylglutamate desuccinylase / Aspartoacylase family protein n=1 Tax=Algoriphagus alkaliphilus TaxID=279824 RepID=A0A1G5ZJE0_9BACT|nr:hypothetical protein [Algoriphagus alkaliphilus]SDA94393.1 hypothetical protein SAMN03080617_03904 [Algoriphagus alkaliphilus]